MKIYFLELPDWHFEAREVSAGVYCLTGLWRERPAVERTGTDTTELLEQCRREAGEMEKAAGRRGEDACPPDLCPPERSESASAAEGP